MGVSGVPVGGPAVWVESLTEVVQGSTGAHLRLGGWFFSKGGAGVPPPGEVWGGAGWAGFGRSGVDGGLGSPDGRRGLTGGWSVKVFVNPGRSPVWVLVWTSPSTRAIFGGCWSGAILLSPLKRLRIWSWKIGKVFLERS